MQTLPISRLINVDVVLSPLAAQAQDLSTLLILGNSNVINVVERLRTYTTLAEVAADFGTSAVEYLAAVPYFNQAPQPDQIKIGRWAQTATKAVLVGGGLSAAEQLMSVFTAITSGNFGITINSVPLAITGLDFSGETNLNGVASVIQTAVAAQSGSATCVWDANYDRFQIQSGSSGADSTISYGTAPTAVGKITFAVNPVNASTITLNGTTVTFVSGTPGANEVAIELTLAETLANLITFLNASTDAEIEKFVCSIVGTILYLKAATAGTGGNALTIAASVATPSAGTLSGATGTDVSAMLGLLSTSSGAYPADGVDAESAADAVAEFDQMFGQTWYALNMPEATDEDHLNVAAYIEGSDNKHIYGVTTQEAGVLVGTSTTDIAYLLSQAGYNRTLVQYSSSSAYAINSLLGRALTVNYNGSATVITLMYKQEPGITAEALNSNQVAALEAKNCNVFVRYNNSTAIVEQGKVSGGQFIDEITGTDWLAVTIMTAVYNLLYTSLTKIPQTDAGVHILVNGVESICSQAVVNGLLAPGVWNSNGFGTLVQGQFLPKGFYVYAQPVALQTQADREARRSPPIQVAAKLAGAVHTVDITINVNR